MEKDVHTEHCCALHGCKYHAHNCTVVSSKKKQSYPCDMCLDDDTLELAYLMDEVFTMGHASGWDACERLYKGDQFDWEV